MLYVKKVTEALWNAIVRGATGCTIIYILSYILKSMELPELVGVNFLNFVIIALLGIPGFLLLYGLSLLFLLL